MKKFDITFEWSAGRLWVAIGKLIGFAIYFGIEPSKKWAWLIVDRNTHRDNLIDFHTLR